MPRARRSKSAAEVPLKEARDKVLAWMQGEYEKFMSDPSWQGYDTKWMTSRIAEGAKLPTNRTTAALKSLEKKGLVKKLGTRTVKELARKAGRGYGQSGALSRKVTYWSLTKEGQPLTWVTLEEVGDLKKPLRIVFEGGNLGPHGKLGSEFTFQDADRDTWYAWKPTGDDADEREFRAHFTKENPAMTHADAAPLALETYMFKANLNHMGYTERDIAFDFLSAARENRNKSAVNAAVRDFKKHTGGGRDRLIEAVRKAYPGSPRKWEALEKRKRNPNPGTSTTELIGRLRF